MEADEGGRPSGNGSASRPPAQIGYATAGWSRAFGNLLGEPNRHPMTGGKLTSLVKDSATKFH